MTPLTSPPLPLPKQAQGRRLVAVSTLGSRDPPSVVCCCAAQLSFFAYHPCATGAPCWLPLSHAGRDASPTACMASPALPGSTLESYTAALQTRVLLLQRQQGKHLQRWPLASRCGIFCHRGLHARAKWLSMQGATAVPLLRVHVYSTSDESTLTRVWQGHRCSRPPGSSDSTRKALYMQGMRWALSNSVYDAFCNKGMKSCISLAASTSGWCMHTITAFIPLLPVAY